LNFRLYSIWRAPGSNLTHGTAIALSAPAEVGFQAKAEIFMKVLSKVLMVGSLIGGVLLVACGNNNSNNITCPPGEINQNNVCIASGVAGVTGSCPVPGQIQTSGGCGQECSYGNSIGGLVGNQCLPSIGGVGGYGSSYGGGYGSPYGVGTPYGNPYGSSPCASIPGTYPVLIGGQMLCQPSYSGYTGGYYGGGYGYYYYR
jgi:hypothetical protein